MDPQSARSRLEQMLADLNESATTLEAEMVGDSGELSTLDQHPADSATDLSDADREEAILEVVVAQREQVRAALRRIDDGTYGTCVDCGTTLPDERLEARPEAARCVQCQAKVEASR
ncbi:MAG: TraR/DksA family transcriptional regulator [Mycobacteriales bacterium]